MAREGSSRRRGAMLIAAGLAIGVAMFAALIVLSRLGVIAPSTKEWDAGNIHYTRTKYSPIWGAPAIVPLFTTLLGAIQLVTGRSFAQLAQAYETMSGARRFVVSVLIVALALAVIFTLVAIAFAIML